MTDKQTQETAARSNMEKDPKDWVAGDEPITGQRSYLKTLSEEAKQPFDEKLTKAQASRRIEELRQVTGRGLEGRRDGPSAQDESESAAGEEGPGSALDMSIAEPGTLSSPRSEPSRDKPLANPAPRSPNLESEEPELAKEEDIPAEDKPNSEGKRGSKRNDVGPR